MLRAAAAETKSPVRVALMNFSTDDNSYRSAQSAIDFTSLVQVQLASIAGIEWVERARLDLARKEIGLSAMSSIAGGFEVRCGKWVKADWMITGRFSSDDQDRRTLFLEITDLQRADVLASGTFDIPGDRASSVPLDSATAQLVAGKLRGLLAEANAQHLRAAGEVAVAPLFFADTGFGIPEAKILQPGFFEALERAATNARVRLIHFPKAYQTIEESEMILDGLVDAKEGWQQSADLFVWGTYAVTNVAAKGRFETKYVVNVNAWDGSSQPLLLSETLDLSSRQTISPSEASRILDRMTARVLGQAQKQKAASDSSAVRHRVADSIVQTYLAMSAHGGWTDGDQNGIDAVHMLETACFFDPGNPNAQQLRILCRWGGFSAKNEFWFKWRRSEAWGKYVDRFGLAPLGIKLPSANEPWGVPEIYLRSLREVIEMCPENFDWSEDESYGPMREAQRHGFPKEISNATAAQWKRDLESEYWDRLNRVAEFVSTNDQAPLQHGLILAFSALVRGILDAKQPPQARLALLERIWPACVAHAKKFGRPWIINGDEGKLAALCAQAGKPERSTQLLALLPELPRFAPTNTLVNGGIHNGASPTNAAPGAQVAGPMTNWSPPVAFQRPSPPPGGVRPDARERAVAIGFVPTPEWYKEIMPNFRMFNLYPPAALPKEVKPERREFQFPAQFEVKRVDQLDVDQGRLLILATDERSAQSSDALPDASAEVRRERGRLWSIGPGDSAPQLFEERGLPSDIRWFLLEDGQLWVAGESVGRLDLRSGNFQKFGLRDGFSIARPSTLARAGGKVFAAGYLHLCRFEPGASRWKEVDIPLEGSYSDPCFLMGNSRGLVLIAGSVRLYNVANGSWTKLPDVPNHYSNGRERMALLAEEKGFWFGTDVGLHFYSTTNRTLQSWRSPAFVQSYIDAMEMGFTVMGGDGVPESELNHLDDYLRGRLLRFQRERAQARTSKVDQETPRDPLGLNYRIPGEVTALAPDGDYMWIGADNYFGKYLLLLHKPSESLVAYVPFRDRISALAVSDASVWVGMAYADSQLVRLSRKSFLSVPSGDWVPMAISSEERQRLVKTMSVRDQAMYAFYAGDDARVVELLGTVDPEKATLEEMFLLAFSYDAAGLNQPKQSRAWFDRIIARYPDSPWAKVAADALAADEQGRAATEREADLVRRFDRNHDGVLDRAERFIMEKDPAYRREETVIQEKQLDAQLEAILRRYDVNQDGKLDKVELNTLKNWALSYSQAPPEMLAGRQLLLAPLITRDFFSETVILRKYDANTNGGLAASELKIFARELRKAP